MGSFLSKLCGNTKKEEDEDDNETNAEKLTNEGSNVDVNSDNPSEPNFLRVDSLARNVERENKVGPIQNTTNTNDGENNIGAQKKKDEQNDMKTNKMKGKHDTSSSDSSSSSDSDCDDYRRKRKEKERRDNVTVYKSTNVKGSITHYCGENITVNKKTVINKHSPAKKITDSSAPFTSVIDDENAAKFYEEMFGKGRNSVIGGNFIDLTPTNMAVNSASERLALDKWFGSVGIVLASRGKCTCFRVGSKYVMTSFNCIAVLLEPELITIENAHLEWQDLLHGLSEKRACVDFQYLSYNEDRQSNRFFFKEFNKDSIPFFDESTNCIILELEQVPGRQFPPPFTKFGLPKLEHKLTLINHHGGRPKNVEEVSSIVNMYDKQTEYDSRKLREQSEEFLNAQGKDVSRFRCEIPPYDILMNRDRFLFHCQCNKGAAGSPGLQVTSDNTVVVVTMLLRGYPDWYYADECADIKYDWNKVYTVEQGANMLRVYEAIRYKNLPLFNDILVPV